MSPRQVVEGFQYGKMRLGSGESLRALPWPTAAAARILLQEPLHNRAFANTRFTRHGDERIFRCAGSCISYACRNRRTSASRPTHWWAGMDGLHRVAVAGNGNLLAGASRTGAANRYPTRATVAMKRSPSSPRALRSTQMLRVRPLSSTKVFGQTAAMTTSFGTTCPARARAPATSAGVSGRRVSARDPGSAACRRLTAESGRTSSRSEANGSG